MTRKGLVLLRLALWMRHNGARLADGTDPEGERLYRLVLKALMRERGIPAPEPIAFRGPAGLPVACPQCTVGIGPHTAADGNPLERAVASSAPWKESTFNPFDESTDEGRSGLEES